ncbi:MAG: tetratricopeptide repeat protein [Verrucomicrobia bacterium]|nr:tetratricopeptide repeat protein [Verrucomicrobiota bacterium]
MESIPAPDCHFLNAAQGWLELGNAAEARLEWRGVSETHQSHPEVIETLWRIQAAEKEWDEALLTAQRLVDHSPGSPSGWIHQSYTLHELRRTQDAHDKLVRVAKRFDTISTIPYNLACYQCQLGDLDAARNWLERAMKIQGRDSIREMALTDADLKPLWPELRNL